MPCPARGVGLEGLVRTFGLVRLSIRGGMLQDCTGNHAWIMLRNCEQQCVQFASVAALSHLFPLQLSQEMTYPWQDSISLRSQGLQPQPA
eukprot:795168-Amphidinium_carterae.1